MRDFVSGCLSCLEGGKWGLIACGGIAELRDKKSDRQKRDILSKVLTERTDKPDIEAVILGEIPIVAKIGFDTGKIELREEGKTNTNMILIQPGDLVLSGINAAKGAIAIYGEEKEGPAAATIHYSSYIVNKDRADILYLWYFMRSNFFRRILLNKLPGGIKTEIKPKRLLPIGIPLPPLEEQKRIVAKIENLVGKVEEAKKLNSESANEAGKFYERSAFELFEIESGKWKLRKICEVMSVNMGQSPPGHSYNKIGEGIPLINGPTEFGDIHPTEVQWTTSPTKICKKGDILICVRGATTGRMNWANKEYCIGRGVAALTANPSVCLPQYTYHFIQTQTKYILSLTAGSTFPNLPGAKLKKMLIPIIPISEQRRVVDYLDSLQAGVEGVRRRQEETQRELAQLVPSILDRAFKGEL